MSDCEDTDDSCGEDQAAKEYVVSKEWLENIFTTFHKEPVVVYGFYTKPESIPSVSSEMMLSGILRVKGKYALVSKEEEPVVFSVIVKQLPKDPFYRFFVTEGQFDLREIMFYTVVMPDLKEFQSKRLVADKVKSDDTLTLAVPMCYYAHFRPVPPGSILVLEDLRESDFKSVNFNEGLSLEQAKVALRGIACIHAHSLTMKVIDQETLPERYPFLFATAKTTDSYQHFVERGFPQLAHFLEGRPGLEDVLDSLMLLRPRTKDLISSLMAPEGPLALITHTDFWCNNLLFREDENSLECRILDWQMVTYSRPTNDIALLLLSSVPTALRRKHSEALLDEYWEALTYTCSYLGLDIPKDLGYTRQDLEKDYRRSQLLAVLLCIGSVDIALSNPPTEQRLIDVLQDLHNDGVLTDEAVISTGTESES